MSLASEYVNESTLNATRFNRKSDHIEVRGKRCQGDRLAREDTAARVTSRGRACLPACVRALRGCARARARDGQPERSRHPRSSSSGRGSILLFKIAGAPRFVRPPFLRRAKASRALSRKLGSVLVVFTGIYFGFIVDVQENKKKTQTERVKLSS